MDISDLDHSRIWPFEAVLKGLMVHVLIGIMIGCGIWASRLGKTGPSRTGQAACPAVLNMI